MGAFFVLFFFLFFFFLVRENKILLLIRNIETYISFSQDNPQYELLIIYTSVKYTVQL
jgi:hypothetical protein